VHRSSGQKKIFGNLASGLTTAHHQDGAWRQAIGIAVITGIELQN
jgi:hypothetical protein